MQNEKQEIYESEKYRRWIASLPCLITGARNVQCAHIRRGADAGMARKPSDSRCVPLSVEQHARQHEIGELKYWYAFGGYETAAILAQQLWNTYHAYSAEIRLKHAMELIAAYRGRWVGRGPGAFRHKFIDEGKNG